MIIHRIQSENFLKYAHLDLDQLPEKGLIAVGGQNESGKTSIGETLCFALFGRTFTLDLDDPRKLIRWGQSQCWVSVDFSDKDGEIYQVKRYLDDAGAYGAKLTRDKDGAVIAKGVERVQDALEALIGFGYEEFIESFYLAQRELSTPHPHSHTIKVMAGIAPLARVRGEMAESAEREQRRLARTSEDYEESRAQLKRLAIDEEEMPRLRAAHDRLASRNAEKRELRDGLESAAEDYRSGLPQLKKARRDRGLARFLLFAFVALALGFWAAWGALTFAPDAPLLERFHALVEARVVHWDDRYQHWLLPLALLFSALGIFEIFQLARLKKRIGELDGNVGRLAEQLDRVRLDTQKPDEVFDDRIQRLLAVVSRVAEDESADDDDLPARIKSVEDRARALLASPEEVTDLEKAVEKRLNGDLALLGRQLEAIKGAITAEQQRLDEAARIRLVSENLNIQVADHMHRIKVNEVAGSLLESASHHLSHRFNQSILQLAGAALPKFTQGRYEHLKIDENLNVRVFSNEKRDFMEFDEISSGTQRQIMLALRLAMSQELIRALESGRQFIFFDEPFAFFDQQRIRETLNALPQFSEEISQIWLVAQEFPENVNVDLFIPCATDAQSLTTG